MIAALDILTALKTALSAVTLPSSSDAAFDRVEYFSQPNLMTALQELRIFKKRVCLIVPDGDQYEHEYQGKVLVSRVVRRVILLLADQDYAVRQSAETGSSGTYGVISLDQRVIAALIGQNLGLGPSVLVRPTFSQPVLIAGNERDTLSGREAWHIDLDIDCGYSKTTNQ